MSAATPARAAAKTNGRARSTLAGKTVFEVAEVRRVEKLIDSSGIVEVLEPLLPAGGRHRDLSLRTLLVGLGLTAAGNSSLYLKTVHAILLALPVGTRRRLGVSWTDAHGREQHLTLRRVEHLYGHLAALVDGSEHFSLPTPPEAPEGVDPLTGEVLDPEVDADRIVELAAAAAQERADLEAERVVRNGRLALVTQLLLGASLPADWTQNGHVAVDATFIDANSQVVHTKSRKLIHAAAAKALKEGRARDLPSLLADDDALARALGIPNFGEDPDEESTKLKNLRKATRRAADPDAATIVYKGALRHAYAAHLAVSVPSEADVDARLAHEEDLRVAKKEDRNVKALMPEPTPHLILGMDLTASTAGAAATCVDLTRRMMHGPDAAAAGVDLDAVPHVTTLPVGDTVIDRGYSESVPENFHHPLHKLGRRLVFDLHPNRRGQTGHFRGAVIAFGNLYSPGILSYPDLITKASPSPFASWKEWQRYFTDAKLRESFRLHTNSAPDEDGYSRMACPALRRGATVGCAIRGTVDLVGTRGLLEVLGTPNPPLPGVCDKQTITVSPDVTARSMDLEWGSEAWYNSYIRRRARVEGANGILKNPAFAALAHMNVRVRGRAKVGLFVAFAAAIANLRAGDRWRADVARVRGLHKAIAGAAKSRRGRSHTLNQLLPVKHRRLAEPAGARAP